MNELINVIGYQSAKKMKYKPNFEKYDKKSVTDFNSSIKSELDEQFIIYLDQEIYYDDSQSFDQLLFFINNCISQFYIPDQSDIEDMFDYPLAFDINSLLNNMVQTFAQQEDLNIEDVKNFHYLQFICYILYRESDDQIVSKAIRIFHYLLSIDSETIDSFIYIKNHLESDSLDVIASSTPIIGYLFNSNYENAKKIIKDYNLIEIIYNIARNPKKVTPCLNAMKLLRIITYNSINVEGNDNLIQPLNFQQIIIEFKPFITNTLSSITNEVLKLFQILSSNPEVLLLSIEVGFEKTIREALGILPNEYMSNLYKIFRNIVYFAHEGQIRTRLTSYKFFFEKTADLIKSDIDENTFDVIITTVDLLGIYFWRDLLELGVLDSILSIINTTNYANKKRICSLLLNIFKDAEVEFRREYCDEGIIEIFMNMLDDDESEFCIELLDNLSFFLSSDPDYFRPMFEQFEYSQYLEDLSQSSNQELAELAQASLDDFIY